MRTISLESDLRVRVPNPARVVILGDASGFHGPLPSSTIDDVSA